MSKNIVVICIYNREQNLKQWLHCWQQCTVDAQLVVIHNSDGETYNTPDWVTYIKRKNIGFDIGAFQDVCRNRLKGFPEWDKLLWVTDDTFPMIKDFADPFFKQLDEYKAGVVCMEISPYVRPHIRTTGFALKKSLAEKLQFTADPVLTKNDCYQFEHLHKLLTFYNQVKAMGLRVQMVAPQAISPLFDTGYHLRLKKREQDHYNLFGMAGTSVITPPVTVSTVSPKVVFICPIYNSYPQIVSSLLCQTYQNWELHLIHDGPGKTDLPKDSRIHYSETSARAGNWGHSIRSEWINKVEGDYLVITNPDNYITPTYIESMLHPHKNGIVASYCSHMVHSYIAWGVIATSLKRGYLDCSGVMVKMSVAKEVGWKDITSHSADWFFFERIIKAKGVNSFAKVNGCLLIHN